MFLISQNLVIIESNLNKNLSFWSMTYELLERVRYEKFWSTTGSKFSKDSSAYTSAVPSPTVVGFAKFLRSEGVSGRVLDLGCGNGRNIIYLIKQGFEGYGVDVAPSAISIAEKNAHMNKVMCNFKVGSAFRLRYPASFFDVLVDFGCLHHLRRSEWNKYLANIARVLKKDGYYFLYCFSLNSGHLSKFSPKSKRRNWTLREGGHYNNFFTVRAIKQLFAKNFQIIKHYEFTKTEGPILFWVFYMKRKPL